MAEPDKKKRRQNVACDACRLRRIKCDMLTLLSARSERSPTPPLHVLLSQNPGVSCTNCINKAIRCTTNQIASPARPNKGGRRIVAAKELYGSDGTPQPSSLPQEGHDLDTFDPTLFGFGFLPDLSAPNLPSPLSVPFATPSGWTTSSHSAAVATLPLGWDVAYPQASISAGGTASSSLAPWLAPDWGSQDLSNDHLGLLSRPSGSKRLREQRDEDEDPWSLWSPLSRREVRWGHPEVVAQQLADRSIGIELSRHLIKVYFESVHYILRIVSPEEFYLDWQRAEERSDRMPPDQEVLCAVIEAWAAHFSDHPVVLSLDKSIEQSSPKVIAHDGTFIPGGAARVHWGRARRDVCDALMRRARRLIDLHELFLKPSHAGLQALCLYAQLFHMSDLSTSDRDPWAKSESRPPSFTEPTSRMMHSIVVEQLKTLEIDWTCSLVISNSDEDHGAAALARRKYRRLFWTVMVSDAFWAAGSGNEPKLSDADVKASGQWLVAVKDQLRPSSLTALWFFLGCFHRCVFIGRDIAQKISVPCKQLGTVNVADFCAAIRFLWRDIRGVYKDMSQHSAEIVVFQGEERLLGFSPIHLLSNVRFGCSFLLLILHQRIDDLTKFRARLREAYVRSASGSAPSTPEAIGPENDRMKMLEEIRAESVDICLVQARAHVHFLKSLLPTGMLQAGSVMLRVLLGLALFISEVPCNEQGYPLSTKGGVGWTWKTKKEAVGAYIEALNQLGWAWSDISGVLEQVQLNMERTEPNADQIAQFSAKHRPPEWDKAGVQREAELRMDDTAVQAAMKFWPPEPVANVVNQWRRQVKWEDTGGSGSGSNPPAASANLPAFNGSHPTLAEAIAAFSDGLNDSTVQPETASDVLGVDINLFLAQLGASGLL